MVRGALVAGYAALAVVLASVGGALASLVVTATAESGDRAAHLLMQPYIWRVALFTVWQAGLSALLSVAGGSLLARALARRRVFGGRALLLKLLVLPLALPQITAVLGVLAILGTQGWLNRGLAIAGFESRLSVYGLTGILIVHVFFNLPLAARLFLFRLERIPGENWRLAAQLGLAPSAIWRILEKPEIIKDLPAVTGLIFMLCAASFTVVLTLGGGPAATTLEVAVYQALRFEFSPLQAAVLAIMQIILGGAVWFWGHRATADIMAQSPRGRHYAPSALFGVKDKLTDYATILICTIFLMGPLLALVIAGLRAPLTTVLQEEIFWHALATSLGIAAIAAILSQLLTLCLLAAGRFLRQQPGAAQARHARVFQALSHAGAGIILVCPPIVLGTGWFLILWHIDDGVFLTPAVIVVINALMALPFLLRITGPSVWTAAQEHDHLCANLGLRGWARLAQIDWPVLRRPIIIGLGFGMALAIGDMAVIALLGHDDLITLPLLLYQRLGHYRTQDAHALALSLAGLAFFILYGAGRIAAQRRWSK